VDVSKTFIFNSPVVLFLNNFFTISIHYNQISLIIIRIIITFNFPELGLESATINRSLSYFFQYQQIPNHKLYNLRVAKFLFLFY
jgi:hypothetical protein